MDEVISRNKLSLFVKSPKITVKGKQQLASLKGDRELFSRMYIACQTRDGRLDEFFCHEKQAWPPSLSQDGSLYQGTKGDVMECLDVLVKHEASAQAPDVTCMVIDRAVAVQMLKPKTSKRFDDYAQKVFIPYLATQL